MSDYYTIALVALLAVISPGPDFVVVTKHALSTNRGNAVMASIGVSVGAMIHVTYCVLGLAVVISHSLILFSLIKYLGASYLIYLGIKSVLSKTQQTVIQNKQRKSTRKSAFIDGFLTNVLNPKCTLFMLSVFTLVVKPHTAMSIQVIYGAEIVFITLIWFVMLSYGLTLPFLQKRLATLQHIVTRIIGFVLMGLGIFVLFESR